MECHYVMADMALSYALQMTLWKSGVNVSVFM